MEWNVICPFSSCNNTPQLTFASNEMSGIPTMSVKLNNDITPDSDEEADIYELYTSTDLYKSLQPFFFNTKIFGLHHRKRFHLATTDAGTKTPKKKMVLERCNSVTMLFLHDHIKSF